MGRMEREKREKKKKAGNSRERSCLFSRVFIQRFVPSVAHGQWPVSTFQYGSKGIMMFAGERERKEG